MVNDVDFRGISDRIYDFRDNILKINRYVFADKLDISYNTIITWENGGALPSSPSLIHMHEKFGVNPNWILLGEGNVFLKR